MKVLVLVLMLALVASCSATMTYTLDEKIETAPSSQLWYEGLWKEVPWLNGTVSWDSKGDISGSIYITSRFAPHEDDIRGAQKRGAIGVVFIRPGNFLPGFSMHIIDGSDRRDITIPVMEVIYPRSQRVDDIAEGTYITINPSPNRHKEANETPFQLIFNLIQSFWEMAIIVVGLYRVYQFYGLEDMPFLSVAPICCMLEVIAALLRLAYTCVDPFYTYRMLPDKASLLFITLHIPFSETAGILLTFFWAESLTKHNVRAVPFISHYKYAAFVAIGFLFVIEIVCDALRLSTQKLGPISIYISLALYLLVAVVLAVCYVATSALIMRKISELGVKSGKRLIRKLTLRIVISAGGYFVLILGIISFAIFSQFVMGRAVSLNIIFIGFNLAGIMQVIALRPMHKPKSSSHPSKLSSGIDSERNGDSVSPDSPGVSRGPRLTEPGIGSQEKLLP